MENGGQSLQVVVSSVSNYQWFPRATIAKFRGNCAHFESTFYVKVCLTTVTFDVSNNVSYHKVTIFYRLAFIDGLW